METYEKDLLDTLPFEPESDLSLLKRIKKAFARVYTCSDLAQANGTAAVSANRKHVFDTTSGYRVVMATTIDHTGTKFRNFLVRRMPEKTHVDISEAVDVVKHLIQFGVIVTAAVSPVDTHLVLHHRRFRYKKSVDVPRWKDGVVFDPADGTFSGAV